MRFVFCAVAICHILRDFSFIDFGSMRNFIRNSLNYDGGIGQGPGDESHGGSTFCAIASLSLANCLWDGSVLSRREIDRLVKWALWKQDEGFHGRAHKPDDSCYAFWIGATLEILNANHLMDKDKLRSFLLIAQHQYMGGFCKIPEASGFPDLLHTYFSIAAFSLLREPGLAPINASLNVSRHFFLLFSFFPQQYWMILLPPADLDQDEAIFRILAHLRTFQQTADSLFDRISSRTEELNATYRSLDTRLKRVQRKVSHLRQMNTSGVLTCLSQFPTCEYSPARDLTPDTDKPANVVFKPKHQPQRVVDMRRELDERKRFYLPSHLMNKNPQEPRKERQLPSKIMSFADMFYCDTDELAYGKRSSKRIGFVSHGKSDTTSSVDVNVVEASAIGGGRTQERDPLDYVPELGPIEDLDLPDILPDLPGIAEDLTLLDYGIVPPMFPDIPVLNEEVQAAPEMVIAANTEMRHSSNDSPQLTLSAAEKEAATDGLPAIGEVKAATIPSPPPAVPPPPPPPPPASLVVNTASPSPPGLPSAPLSNDRSDLMAAIRAAGGAGKAKLKKVNSSRRAAKESESLSSSALGENKSSAGGDLMASLAKALEARRKGIYGFALYISSYCLLILYLLWAIVPTPILNRLGITYVPAKYWVIAIPSLIVLSITTFVVVVLIVNIYRFRGYRIFEEVEVRLMFV
ncbi:prenyltransferase and squalene oxidase repeat-containing domain protein [Cooperia oncophora]